jgi:hypothetical protein
MSTLYHRIPLIRAQELRVGLGHATGSGQASNVVVVDVIRGLGANVGDGLVIYPADGQTGVPLEFGPEVPDPVPSRPAGYPITLTYSHGGEITAAQATLSKVEGDTATEVEIVVSTPQEPATDFDQQNTVCFFTTAPLEPNTKYKAEVSYELSGEPKTTTWTFTTGVE